MPRITCRPSDECVANNGKNGNGRSNSNNSSDKANGNHDDSNSSSNNGSTIVKQEFNAAPPVCHRKSERRKIARDIFLVFEEQPTRRRRGGRGGSRGTRAKQKFGHLKVANAPRLNKHVLRDIKTEPKCSATTTAAAAEAATMPAVQETEPPLQPEKELLVEPVKLPLRMAAVKLETKTTAAATVAAPMQQISQSYETLAATAKPMPAPTSMPASTPIPTTTPSVNPIFLWVKQDDTRIVEVRCEDYDKRNRIRLTKTTNGWRSMPRTDASSTRIVKFFHSTGVAAPLIKVKREHLQQQQSLEDHEDQQEQEEVVAQEEQHQHQSQQQHEWTVIEEHVQHQPAHHKEETNNLAVIENVVVMHAAQQQEEEEHTPPPSSTDVCFDALLDSETNASTKATKTSNSNPNTPTYQSSRSSTPAPAPLELQLCPKTGLFLTNLPGQETEEEQQKDSDDEEDIAEQHCVKQDQSSLDANTKQLKDLLDDADDLLQHCSSDHGSSNGADLLDSLVKRSCEDNLMQQQQQQSQPTAAAAAPGVGLSSFCVPDLMAGKELPRILGMDSGDDAPKCLSFNEAGEIEGLNGELFLSIDSFDKPEPELEEEVESVTETNTVLLTKTPLSLDKESSSPPLIIVPDETPKDLSYKKREEVCPPSESRSQCAVTSSSDILKSKSPEPELLQLPANTIPAEVETTSETIKHLILEQFLKLNGNAQQQAEPIDLGKAAVSTVGDKLQTVVIDDEDEPPATEPTEPLKKRPKPIKMDKDPDALTQLKMLISNPQWKVPDPILVPKDRLGAVLASPAREIPLLLTTRPELRLPEAFAYPQIIQNPNILVVTMEQLEAILRNETDQSKSVKPSLATQLPQPVAASPAPTPELPSSKSFATPSPRPSASPAVKTSQPSPLHQQHQLLPKTKVPTPIPPVAVAPPISPAADSSMSTELNATTLALLQQMLWLPYFGQLSQEFFKSLKDPLGMQRKFMSNLLPLYNSQFGLQHLDELYKHCLKQKPISNEEPTSFSSPAPAPAPASAPAPTPKSAPAAAAFNGFSNPMELAFMQKLIQQQQQQQPHPSKDPSSHHHLENKRARRDPEGTPLHIPDFNSNYNSNNNKQQQHQSKTPATVAVATAAATPPATLAAAATSTPVATTAAAAAAVPASTPPVEHKPRLTCKSLSNLLEPESNMVPLLNVPFDALRRSSLHKTIMPPEPSSGRQLRSSKACITYNPLDKQSLSQQSQLHLQQQLHQRKRGNMLVTHDVQQQQYQQQHQQQHQQQQQHLAEAAAAAAVAGGATMDANGALWHPLFGSNPKQGYNSPWQWTTVTATGE